jgi:hypothetical protein
MAEGPFGDDDDIAPNRIRRGYCNRLFRLTTNLDQSTTKTKEVKKWQKAIGWRVSSLFWCWAISRLRLLALLRSRLSGRRE